MVTMSRRVLLAIWSLLAPAAPSEPPGNRRRFPNVPLVTQDGDAVWFYDDLVKGKIVMFNFFYTRCDGLCTPATSNLRKVQQLLGDRVGCDMFMYSITLKPHEDTPRDLKRYREAYDVGPGWTFLTGHPAACDLVRRRLGFADSDPKVDRDVTQHSGLVVFGNEPLDSWSACPAVTSPSEIVRAVSWVDWR
jgi:protein SCO1/2